MPLADNDNSWVPIHREKMSAILLFRIYIHCDIFLPKKKKGMKQYAQVYNRKYSFLHSATNHYKTKSPSVIFTV